MICVKCGSEFLTNTNVCICGGIDSARGEIYQGGLLFTSKQEEEEFLGSVLPYESVPEFTHINFATAIYHDKPKLHREPFLLPGLYGGELCQGDHPYRAMLVFEAPSITFTERHWRQNRWTNCTSVATAIKQHRETFLAWAYDPNSKQARLFFDRLSPSRKCFFRRFYVTDIWKDGEKTHSPKDKLYWERKLRIELNEVPADWYIFIGKQAARGIELMTPRPNYRCIGFPGQWVNDEEAYGKEFDKQLGDIVAGFGNTEDCN